MGIVALDAESVGGSSIRGKDFQPARHDTTGPIPAHSWHDELKRAIRYPYQLITALELPAEFIQPARNVAKQFSLFAPWPYVARMAKGDPTDPLLRQV